MKKLPVLLLAGLLGCSEGEKPKINNRCIEEVVETVPCFPIYNGECKWPAGFLHLMYGIENRQINFSAEKLEWPLRQPISEKDRINNYVSFDNGMPHSFSLIIYNNTGDELGRYPVHIKSLEKLMNYTRVGVPYFPDMASASIRFNDSQYGKEGREFLVAKFLR